MSRLVVLAYMSLCVPLARARADEGIDAWARWAMTPKVWKGQTVLAPDGRRRQAPRAWLDAERLPLRVHATLAAPAARVELARDAAVAAYEAWLQEPPWWPYSDGGHGGSVALDLYLEPDRSAPAQAACDAPVTFTDFDAAQCYALVDARLPRAQLPACVHSAVVQAALRAHEPAEAESLLRGSGDYFAYAQTGALGCDESMVRAQHEVALGLLGEPEIAGAQLALLLAMLSEQHPGVVPALWELARQRSRGLVAGDRLRGSPDAWEALSALLRQRGRALPDVLAELAASRYFAGSATRRAAAAFEVLEALPSDGAVPALAEARLQQLPARVRTSGEGLFPLGSAYVRVRTAGARDGETLQAWLRGERGPSWSLIAMRLAADGHELGRMTAPARRVPQSYLPIVLDAATAEVVLVVTYLIEGTPDSDLRAPSPHGFELLLDRDGA